MILEIVPLGYDYRKDFSAYGHRIFNVHVKDRIYRGSTVPLGEGDAKLNESLNVRKLRL